MIKLNDVKIEPTIFPDKTSQVWKIAPELFKKYSEVVWNFENEAELFHLAQLKDLLDEKKVHSVLFMPYLPYARQDKEIDSNTTFALRSFCKIINEMDWDGVSAYDPHSKVASTLLRNFEPVWPNIRVKDICEEISANLICYPDSGAKMKYCDHIFMDFISASKEREPLTGNILKLSLNIMPKYKNTAKRDRVLIVDDICDGGGTFIMLAKELKEWGYNDINLFVSHGLFTKGTKALFDAGIKRIFTKEGEIK